MNTKAVKSFVGMQSNFDDCQVYFSKWCQKMLEDNMNKFQEEMNAKMKQMNDLLLKNVNSTVNSCQKMVPNVQKALQTQPSDNNKPKNKNTFTQVVKKKKPTKKSKPTIIGTNIGLNSTYPTKNTALHVTAAKSDNEESVRKAVQDCLKTFDCEVKVEKINEDDKMSTYRAQLLNIPRSTKNDFYTAMTWPFGWFVRGWNGNPTAEIKKVMRLNVSRLSEHQDAESIIQLIKKINDGDYTIKAEMNNLIAKPGLPKKYITRSCKVLLQGNEIPSFQEIDEAFKPYGSLVRHWKGHMVFNDEVKPKLISFINSSSKRMKPDSDIDSE